MKLDPNLISNAWNDYISFGKTSAAYIMRKYKLSRELANKVIKEIEKRSKPNFNAKRCKSFIKCPHSAL